jgi:hypothetical protein
MVEERLDAVRAVLSEAQVKEVSGPRQSVVAFEVLHQLRVLLDPIGLVDGLDASRSGSRSLSKTKADMSR